MIARRATESLILGLTVLSGLGCAASNPGGDEIAGPDLAAITTVVKDVYRQEGQSRMIFLAVEEPVDDALMEETLEQDLGVKVRPESEADRTDLSLPVLTPKLPETGEIGISIQLSRFSLDDDGKLHVTVLFVRCGLDGGIYEYVLEHTDAGWSIADVIPRGQA